MATSLLSAQGLTDRELEFRRSHIGASESASIMGYNPWRNAADIYYAKVAGIESEASPMARAGQALEPIILNHAAEQLEVDVNFQNKRRVYPDESAHMQATIDAFITGRNEIIEAKLTGDFAFKKFQENPANINDRWGDEWTDMVPRCYMVQVVHQLHVLRAQTGEAWGKGYVALRIGLTDQRMYVVSYNAEIGNAIEETCRDFWAKHVALGIPPTECAAGSDTLARIPRVAGKTVRDMDPTWIPAYERAHADFTAAEKAKEDTRGQILQFMGDAEIAIDTAGRVATYRQVNASRFDAKGFRAAHPELGVQFTSNTQSRRFSVRTK